MAGDEKLKRGVPQSLLALGIAVLVAAVLVLDLLLPLGIAAGLPYIIPTLLSVWLRRRHVPWLVAGACTVLTFVGMFPLESPAAWYVWVANRALTLFAIWSTAAVGVLYQRTLAQLRQYQCGLEDRIRERTAELAQTAESLRREVDTRRAAEAALQVSRDRLQEAQRIAMVGGWEYPLPDGPLRMTEGAKELFGLSAQDSPDLLVQRIHAEDRGLVTALLQRARQGAGRLSVECRLLGADGAARWVIIAAEHHDGTSSRGVLAGTIQDISERRLLEERLRESQKLDSIGRLAGGIAHDFNNVLAIIQGQSEMALRKAKGCQCERSLEAIRGASERGANLTRQLLAFARRQIVMPRVVSPNAMLNNLRGMLERLVGEDVSLRFVLDESAGNVRMDVGQFEQIVLNLVGNARDAMPKGGSLTIETAGLYLDQDYVRDHPEAQVGHHVLLSVTDTGEGMSPETRQRIFEPFFTTKGVGRGTGLGLATVFGIVKQNGGLIGAYSEPGRGTTFRIYLPLVTESATAEVHSITGEVPAGRGETLLLVEDDAALRELCAEILRTGGYHVIEAEDGRHALQLAAAQSPGIALVVTDVVMPGMRAPEFVRLLHVARPGLPVLYMSGYTENAIVHQGVVEPGIQFIQKPFGQNSLLGRVRGLLDAQKT